LFFLVCSIVQALDDLESLRATGLQSIKWLTEYSRPRATILSFALARWNVVYWRHKFYAKKPASHRVEVDAHLHKYKNRFIAGGCDCGDNLSVRFHIQNSISLTMAASPRIIAM
jgi:hypothetical protein